MNPIMKFEIKPEWIEILMWKKEKFMSFIRVIRIFTLTHLQFNVKKKQRALIKQI